MKISNKRKRGNQKVKSIRRKLKCKNSRVEEVGKPLTTATIFVIHQIGIQTVDTGKVGWYIVMMKRSDTGRHHVR